jgi:hypothetical protein
MRPICADGSVERLAGHVRPRLFRRRLDDGVMHLVAGQDHRAAVVVLHRLGDVATLSHFVGPDKKGEVP